MYVFQATPPFWLKREKDGGRGYAYPRFYPFPKPNQRVSETSTDKRRKTGVSLHTNAHLLFVVAKRRWRVQ